MHKTSRIFVAGSDTMIGRAIGEALGKQGYTTVQPSVFGAPSEQFSIDRFFAEFRPQYVFMAAGKSGGIGSNQAHPADLMLDNLQAAVNTLGAAHKYGVRKLLYLASSCCYPRECPQPMRVDYLMTGELEPTNKAYASAKLAGITLCEAYRRQYGAKFVSVIPANVFGPGDDFSREDSHVIAAIIRKLHEARLKSLERVTLWGTGMPRREFLCADDLADACLFLMEEYDGPGPINVGAASQRFSIRELAVLIREAVGYEGEIEFDPSQPDGMPCKFLDSEPLRQLGWSEKTEFRAALSATYQHFLQSEQVKHA